MAPFFNTKSIALFAIFFLAVASSEASRGINPTASTAAAATVTYIDDLFSSAVLGRHASLRDYNPYTDPNRQLNITVKCMLSILDFTTCLDYFSDKTIPAPPEVCCNGYVALSKSPACVCQIIHIGWILPNTPYFPHLMDAPAKCGIKQSTTPIPPCDAYMPPVPSPPSSPSPAPMPAA